MRKLMILILALFFAVSCTQQESVKENKVTVQYFDVPFDSITPELLLDSGFSATKPKRLFYPEQQDSGWMCEYHKDKEWIFYIMHILDKGDTINRYSMNIKYSDDENN